MGAFFLSRETGSAENCKSDLGTASFLARNIERRCGFQFQDDAAKGRSNPPVIHVTRRSDHIGHPWRAIPTAGLFS